MALYFGLGKSIWPSEVTVRREDSTEYLTGWDMLAVCESKNNLVVVSAKKGLTTSIGWEQGEDLW